MSSADPDRIVGNIPDLTDRERLVMHQALRRAAESHGVIDNATRLLVGESLVASALQFGHAPNIVSQVAFGIMTGSALSVVAGSEFIARAFGKGARDLGEQGEDRCAAVLMLLRSQMMRHMPCSRARTTVSALRAMEHAVRSGDLDFAVAVGDAVIATLEALPRVSRSRVHQSITDLHERFGRLDDLRLRSAGRLMLVQIVENVRHPHAFDILAETASDYLRVASDLTLTALDSDNTTISLFARSRLYRSEDNRDFLDVAIEQAAELFTEAFIEAHKRYGARFSDRFVIDTAASEPVQFVLEAYVRALEHRRDSRAPLFAELVHQRTDLSRVHALAVLAGKRTLDFASDQGRALS